MRARTREAKGEGTNGVRFADARQAQQTLDWGSVDSHPRPVAIALGVPRVEWDKRGSRENLFLCKGGGGLAVSHLLRFPPSLLPLAMAASVLLWAVPAGIVVAAGIVAAAGKGSSPSPATETAGDPSAASSSEEESRSSNVTDGPSSGSGGGLRQRRHAGSHPDVPQASRADGNGAEEEEEDACDGVCLLLLLLAAAAVLHADYGLDVAGMLRSYFPREAALLSGDFGEA